MTYLAIAVYIDKRILLYRSLRILTVTYISITLVTIVRAQKIWFSDQSGSFNNSRIALGYKLFQITNMKASRWIKDSTQILKWLLSLRYVVIDTKFKHIELVLSRRFKYRRSFSWRKTQIYQGRGQHRI